MNSGILLIDKPSGITSAACLNKLKKQLNLKKIGHAGTLDPFATGLLVCLLGRATKLAAYVESGEKVYSGIMTFGKETTTDDREGEVVRESDNIPSEEQVQKVIEEKFIGRIKQIPPRYSAIKVKGKRAYDLARAGEDFVLPEREIEVFDFQVKQKSEEDYSYQIRCSVGTYIRSLAKDLGLALDSAAYVKELRRESSYPFSVETATRLSDANLDNLLPWSSIFPQVANLILSDKLVALLKNGSQHGLAQVRKNYASEISDLKFVVYQAENSKTPLGLLINDGKKLEFGFIDL